MPARIGHVTPWGIPCGVAKHLSYWLPELPLERESIILAERPPDYYAPYQATGRWPAVRCWQRGKETALADLCAEAESWHVGILHFQWDPTFFPPETIYELGEWAQEHGVKITFTLHIIFDESHCEWANKAIIKIADQLVVGTPVMAEALEAYAARFQIRPRRPVKIIPLSCPPLINIKPSSFAGGPVILTWGLLGHVKGHLQVHQAVLRLRERGYPQARYVIAGLAVTGEQQQLCSQLRGLAANDGEIIEIREGWHSEEEIYSMCRAAQVIVLNHQWRYPSSSGTVAASVASGTPVVVSASPMFSGYVESGAVLVAGGDANQMADSIESALKNPEALDAGRAAFLPSILPAAVGAAYEQTYHELES